MGNKTTRIPYGDEPEFGDKDPPFRCVGCGTKLGYIHHVDCKLELCPICGDPMYRCKHHVGIT